MRSINHGVKVVPNLKSLVGAASVAAVTATIPASSNAGLIIDVRAVGSTGGVVVHNSKLIDVYTASPGATVTCNVFAVVTGQDADTSNDGILSFAGSFLTTDVMGNGAYHGNLVARRAATMMGTGGSNGFVQDLDGDGDLDVGSNNNSSANSFFSARSSTAPDPVFGHETLVATLTLTMTQVIGFGDTWLNFRPRIAGTAGSWFEDGTQITSSNFFSGPAVVTLVDPEPTSASLLGLPLSFSVLARRRASGIVRL